jgi:hypothetical protein
MADMCYALGIRSNTQQQAVYLLSATTRGFMRSDLFRERLIKSLANRGDSAIHLQRINSEIEALVEQQLFIRQVKSGEREIGLQKIVWRIPPEAISSVRDATEIVMNGCLFEENLCNIVENVKRQLRKTKVSRKQVSDNALTILVSRFATICLNAKLTTPSARTL